MERYVNIKRDGHVIATVLTAANNEDVSNIVRMVESYNTDADWQGILNISQEIFEKLDVCFQPTSEPPPTEIVEI